MDETKSERDFRVSRHVFPGISPSRNADEQKYILRDNAAKLPLPSKKVLNHHCPLPSCAMRRGYQTKIIIETAWEAAIPNKNQTR